MESNQSSLEHITLGALHGISCTSRQQQYSIAVLFKAQWLTAITTLVLLHRIPYCSANIKSASLTVASLGTLARFFSTSLNGINCIECQCISRSSMVQNSWGKCTEQYCMSNQPRTHPYEKVGIGMDTRLCPILLLQVVHMDPSTSIILLQLQARVKGCQTRSNHKNAHYRGGAAGPAGPVLAGPLFGRIIIIHRVSPQLKRWGIATVDISRMRVPMHHIAHYQMLVLGKCAHQH